ncbi:MAG: hypothetical protein H6Q21_1351 [Bacteroidetes bacterium]|jgi:hypothetical protein|nr:hypothetical protein [Bacteroidota bacterium]MBS1233929.1 hypothetical protein [Bacteroidota bacterium]
MKKIIAGLLIAVTSIYGTVVIAQQDPVNSLFEKYAGKEGFTTVHLTGDLLKMAAKMDSEDKDMKILSQITEIKVLAQESTESQPSGLNFHSEIWPGLDKSAYKELLIVKEKDQDVKMLARENGDIISEFLIIVSGLNENVLVQIKGNMNLNDMDQLSDSFDFEGFDQLTKLE